MLSYCIVLSSLVIVSSCLPQPLVRTQHGTVKGEIKKSFGGIDFFSFRGIPYAKPPVGKLRFKLPEVASNWDGIYEASKDVICLQVENSQAGSRIPLETGGYVNSKDFVNFWEIQTSSGLKAILIQETQLIIKEQSTNKKAVMVFIHGGYFLSGTSSLYGPEYFMDKDVVLVTLNYRLGPFGFLSDGTKNLPGNLGLWDQRLALIWVQQNIEAFGGDRKKVTLFGESAGSASVMMHLFSPHSKEGLFQSAIAQSGLPNSNFVKSDKHPRYYAKTLAAELRCDPETTSVELAICLQSVSGETLVEKAFYMINAFNNVPLVFKPHLDDFNGVNAFLPHDPWLLVTNGSFDLSIPLIIGTNKDDGLLYAAAFNKEPRLFRELERNWDKYGPGIMFYRDIDEQIPREKEIAMKYIQDRMNSKLPRTANRDGMKKLIELYGDPNFIALSRSFARKLSSKKNVPIYEYSYEHQGTASLADMLGRPIWQILAMMSGDAFGFNVFSRNKLGVCHADELFLQFKFKAIAGVFGEVRNDPEDDKTSDVLLTLWTDFAKTIFDPTPQGSPLGVKWLPLSKNNNKHLKIRNGEVEMTNSPEMEERQQYWEQIWEEIPPTIHLQRSKTWSDPKLYKNRMQTNSGKLLKIGFKTWKN